MRRAFLTALLAATLAWTGCGKMKPLPTEPDGGGPPPPDATFTRVQTEVFSVSCALAGCHAGNAPTAGMDLSAGVAYGNIVGVTSTERADLKRIEPGDPDRSYLVKKIRGDADISGGTMPLVGSITGGQRQLVIDWVRRGAPQD
jgi:hypothetical protein